MDASKGTKLPPTVLNGSRFSLRKKVATRKLDVSKIVVNPRINVPKKKCKCKSESSYITKVCICALHSGQYRKRLTRPGVIGPPPLESIPIGEVKRTYGKPTKSIIPFGEVEQTYGRHQKKTFLQMSQIEPVEVKIECDPKCIDLGPDLVLMDSNMEHRNDFTVQNIDEQEMDRTKHQPNFHFVDVETKLVEVKEEIVIINSDEEDDVF